MAPKKFTKIPILGRPLYRALFSISISNLNWLPLWRELIFATPRDQYYLPSAQPLEYFVLIANVFALALLVYMVLGQTSKLSRPYDLVHSILVLLLLINPLNFARMSYTFFIGGLSSIQLWSLMILLLVLLILLVTFHRFVANAVAVLIILVSPFAATNIAQAIWAGTSIETQTGVQIPALSDTPSHHPLIWITFDELDGRYLFSAGLKGKTPHFEQFKSQATYVTKVSPPGGLTLLAMPSFWLGRRVRAYPKDHDTLMVRANNAEYEELTATSHLFRLLKNKGLRLGLVGYYHPYCRLFIGLYSSCVNRSYGVVRGEAAKDWRQAWATQLRVLTPLWGRQVFIESFHQIQSATKELVTDNRIDIKVIHHPLPHDPPIFNASTGKISSIPFGADYFNNIVLADLALGQIINTLKRAHLWQRSTIIISSDHGWRKKLGDRAESVGAIPLLIKFAGQSQAELYHRQISALLIKDLILAIVDGKIRTEQQLVRWLHDSKFNQDDAPKND